MEIADMKQSFTAMNDLSDSGYRDKVLPIASLYV